MPMFKTKPSLKQQYKEGVQWLDDNFAYFLTHILNIGEPKDFRALPTAAIAVQGVKHGDRNLSVDTINEKYDFLFNPDFAASLDTEAMAFVMAHETMHVLLNHLKLGQSFKNPQRFNVAADCVINDYLHSMGFDVPKIPDGQGGEAELCIGKNIVGYDCANATVTQVYNDVKVPDCPSCGGDGQEKDQNGDDTGQPCPDCNGTGESGEGDSDGKGGYGKYAPGAGSIDDHGWIHDASEAAQKAAEKAAANNPSMPADLQKTKDQDDGKPTKGYSPVGIGGPGAFAEVKGIGLKWAELLQKINPFMFKKGPRPAASWHARPRKLAAFPSVRLPVEGDPLDGEGGEIPAIVMALDTSGSIGQDDANKFVNLAKSIPQDKIKLFVCTFTTDYMELDLENPQWNSGGTSFSAIERYIADKVMPENRKKYPKAVVVITDGMATFDRESPDAEHHDKYHWLMTRGGHGGYYGTLPGTEEPLDNYAKGM